MSSSSIVRALGPDRAARMSERVWVCPACRRETTVYVEARFVLCGRTDAHPARNGYVAMVRQDDD
jgi:hypothetical protein